jgi:hypothetical protein
MLGGSNPILSLIDGIPQPLFAAQIPFRRLEADVAK